MSDLREAVRAFLWSDGQERADTLAALMKAYDESAAQTPAADAGLDVERLARAFRALSPWRDDETFLDVWHGEAVDLAREYDRLSREEPERER